MGKYDFPTTFHEHPQPLPADLGDYGNEAVEDLARKGYGATIGVTLLQAPYVMEMAKDRDIREFCPKDPTSSRFGSLDSFEAWLGKGDEELDEFGRAMVLPHRLDAPQIPVGHGWVGPEVSKVFPGLDITFAERIGPDDRGNGLAVPFAKLIVAVSGVVYGAPKVWLETWASNHAGGVYTRAGFVEKEDAQKPDTRPTTYEPGEITPHGLEPYELDGKNVVDDVRLYMRHVPQIS